MADWVEYFSKQTAPANLKETKTAVTEFAASHRASGRSVVLITSGGTTVPLENNAVRFIDNFSVGTRGSSSAEYFLEQGYAVIFLHRQRSLQPFLRHIPHDMILDMLDFREDAAGGTQIEVDQSKIPKLKYVLKKYKEVQAAGTLLMVEFSTLSDYLFLLRTISEASGPHGPGIMFYLAAAVSDFYIPDEKMPEHKIQSDGGPLTLCMEQVPKMLSPLVKEWASNAFVVSFKLETDVNIISKKARQALNKYQHQAVVSNILQTRKKTVVIVTPTEEKAVWMSDAELETGREIEEKIVADLIKMHQEFMAGSVVQAPLSTLLHAACALAGKCPPGTIQANQLPSGSTLQPETQFAFAAQPQIVDGVQIVGSPAAFIQCSVPPNVHNVRLRKGETNLTALQQQAIVMSQVGDLPQINVNGNSNEEMSQQQGNTPRSQSQRFGVLADTCLTGEMKTFIETFRARRIALCYTQDDVGNELSRTNGPSYSQSFISRFESKNLGLKAAEKMKPILQAWIEQKELECAKGLRVCKKRKRRTSFSNEAIQVLVRMFQQNPKPNSVEIAQIAENLGLEPVTVRVWFCNRKQMIKRMATGKVRVNNSLKAELEAKAKTETDHEQVTTPTNKNSDKLDFTNMPVGQFSFTEDRVKPLVCLASESSPPKSTTTTATVTYTPVQEPNISQAPPAVSYAQMEETGMVRQAATSRVEHAAMTGLNYEGNVAKQEYQQEDSMADYESDEASIEEN